jgi:hypothetical protein
VQTWVDNVQQHCLPDGARRQYGVEPPTEGQQHTTLASVSFATQTLVSPLSGQQHDGSLSLRQIGESCGHRHRPPQPSLAPHPLPAQVGVQPHLPADPPPPQVCGAWQVWQNAPFAPHAPSFVPARHVVPLQQPAQARVQSTFRPQLFLIVPHLLAQVVATGSSVQPHWPGAPPPPHVCGETQTLQRSPVTPQAPSLVPA